MNRRITANVEAVRERIARAAERVGRDPETICLIAAAKTMPADAVREALDAGITDIGQNYVQEGVKVKEEVGAAARWHLIGHLQSNKAARAAESFDVVQTVDRAKLADVLAGHAAAASRPLEVLIEVNVAGEASKSGVAPADLAELVATVRGHDALRLQGLMAIPPAESGDDARSHFQTLRQLRDEHGLSHLSMGMTGDFEVAIEEGATMVRVGRAIFGDRR